MKGVTASVKEQANNEFVMEVVFDYSVSSRFNTTDFKIYNANKEAKEVAFYTSTEGFDCK